MSESRKTKGIQYVQKIGVTGVPTYVINDLYAVVGAHPYEMFKRALAQILK
jgi:predicted DsbA family dithiol-disulfide isomerase